MRNGAEILTSPAGGQTAPCAARPARPAVGPV